MSSYPAFCYIKINVKTLFHENISLLVNVKQICLLCTHYCLHLRCVCWTTVQNLQDI